MTNSVLLPPLQAESRVLEETIDSFKKTEEGLKELARQMRLLAHNCSRYPDQVLELWKSFEREMPAGAPDGFRETFEGFFDLIDGRLRICRSLLELAENFFSKSGISLGVEDTFSTAIGRLQSLRSRMNELWDWMNAPRPPVNQQMVQESRLARERGEVEDVKDILERFQQGGSLFGDQPNG